MAARLGVEPVHESEKERPTFNAQRSVNADAIPIFDVYVWLVGS
jgi:hypothetical protein